MELGEEVLGRRAVRAVAQVSEREVTGLSEPEREMVSQEEGTNPIGSVAMMQSLGFIEYSEDH